MLNCIVNLPCVNFCLCRSRNDSSWWKNGPWREWMNLKKEIVPSSWQEAFTCQRRHWNTIQKTMLCRLANDGWIRILETDRYKRDKIIDQQQQMELLYNYHYVVFCWFLPSYLRFCCRTFSLCDSFHCSSFCFTAFLALFWGKSYGPRPLVPFLSQPGTRAALSVPVSEPLRPLRVSLNLLPHVFACIMCLF
jgi:hypothetical protein